MWILLGGLAALGFLLAAHSSGSPRESSPHISYIVHGYWAPHGYVIDSNFAEESEARRYADQERTKHPDMNLAMAAIVDGKIGTILMAHPPGYNPWKDSSSHKGT